MRRTQGRRVSVSVSSTPAQILPANPDRIAILLPAIPSNRITISTIPSVTDGQGLILTAGTGLQRLLVTELGQIVTSDWYAVLDVIGPQTLVFWELLWRDEE